MDWIFKSQNIAKVPNLDNQIVQTRSIDHIYAMNS